MLSDDWSWLRFWSDWTYGMLYRDVLVITVWSLLVSSATQSVGHLRTAWVTGHQHSVTELGPVMTKRELVLGIKMALRVMFDILLVMAVTWHVDFGTSPIVLLIVIPMTISAWAVVWWMIRFLIVLQRELGFDPVAVTSFSEDTAATIDQTATDMTEVKADVRDIRNRMESSHD